MFDFLKKIFRQEPKKSETIEQPGMISLTEHFKTSHKCPDCGHKSWLAGPEGGINRNVKCGNCGARFNLAIVGGGIIGAERI